MKLHTTLKKGSPNLTLTIEFLFDVKEILVNIPSYKPDHYDGSQECFDEAVESYLLAERVSLPEYSYVGTLTRCDKFDLNNLKYYIDVEFIDTLSKNKFKLMHPELKFL